LLAQGKVTEADIEFKAVLAEKLPSDRSLAWAAVGLADIASRTGRTDEALKYAESAIVAEAEYGASLAARNIRNKLNRPASADESIKGYFSKFDQIAVSNRKADLEALIMPGEISRFAGGISGGTTEWKTDIKHVDRLDADTVLVETAMAVRLLNREVESGIGVFRLTQTSSGWKMSGVDIFEVR
jgi:hypothetical protein